MFWLRQGVRDVLRLVERTKSSLLFSTGSPWVNVLIGSRVSQISGVPYVVDFQDHWAEGVPFGWPSARAQKRARGLEAEVVQQAALITVGYPRIKEGLVSLHGPEVAAKTRVLMWGVDPDDIESARSLRPTQALAGRGRFTILHVGKVREHHSPACFRKLLSAVAELRCENDPFWSNAHFVFIGANPSSTLLEWLRARGLEGWCQFYARIPYMQCLSLEPEADAFLIYIVNSDQVTPTSRLLGFPTKTFEYLAHKKPILYVCERHHDLPRYLEPVPRAFFLDPGRQGSFHEELREFGRRVLSGVTKAEEGPTLPSRSDVAHAIDSFLGARRKL